MGRKRAADSKGKVESGETSRDDKAGKVSFEAAMTQLESIVANLESGELGLSEAIARYEKGVGLLRQCHATLQSAEQKIRVLMDVTEDGELRTAPFDDDQESTPGTRKQRSSGRSPKPRSGERDDDGEEADDNSLLF